ncbi:MAG: SDR family oxidoreductase [Candidatus Bathyarchaeia archaeon]
MRLADKVAIITGGASGIGKSSALLFAREGASVVVTDVQDLGEQTVSSIISEGGQAVFVKADVSRSSDAEGVVRLAVKTFQKVDILLNCAGLPQKTMPFYEIPVDLWDRIYEVNVKGIFLMSKYSIFELKKSKGVIINVASISGIRPRKGNLAYASSKAAVIGLTRALALELAPDVRVNCINPVATETPMLEKFFPDNVPTEEAIRATLDTIPLQRLCKPEDVAYAALFLASDEATMITGACIDVDGGRGI